MYKATLEVNGSVVLVIDKNSSFADCLTFFIERDGRTVRKLSQLSVQKWGVAHKIVHNTMSRWLKGTKPRRWQGVVQLAVLLRLSEGEANQLLLTSGHGGLAELRGRAAGWEVDLFGGWDEVAVVPSVFNPPFQAPPMLPVFTGRGELINQVKQNLIYHRDPLKAQWYCLEGMGGVGKTTLALALAYQLRPHFPDGVLWARLDRSRPMVVLQSFAMALGVDVSGYTDLASRSSRVRDLLAHKRVLVVLDDVLGDEQVRPLLPPTGACAVIMTTRRHDLAVADGGYRVGLASFDVGKGESLALFGKVLGEEVVLRERAVLQEVADCLGHLPLAIMIVANRLKYDPGRGAAGLLAELQEGVQKLSVLQRGDFNVRLSFELSYGKLTEGQKGLFGVCGLVEGADFAAEAVAAGLGCVLVEAEAGLGVLYDLSLLLPGREGRFMLHPLLRDFSREQVAPAGAAGRLTDYFMAYAQTHMTAYDVLDGEMVSILFALEQVGGERFCKTVQGLYGYWQTRGLYGQAEYYLQRAEVSGRGQPLQLDLAQTLTHLGHVAHKQGEAERAIAYYEEALALASGQPTTTGNQSLVLTIRARLGAIMFRRGAYGAAEGHYRMVLEIAQRQGDERQEAAMLTNLGLLLAEKGEPDLAEERYVAALALARPGSDQGLTITILQNLGDIMDERGDYAQARRHYSEGLRLANALKDPELQSRMLGNIGLVDCALGNYTAAAAYFRRGLSLAESSGLGVQIARQLANLGVVATHRHDYGLAHHQFDEALERARQSGFPSDVRAILNLQGLAYLQERRFADGARVFAESLGVVQVSPGQQEVAMSLYGLAQVAAWRGNRMKARELGQESYGIFAAIGHKRANEVRWWLAELPSEVVDDVSGL